MLSKLKKKVKSYLLKCLHVDFVPPYHVMYDVTCDYPKIYNRDGEEIKLFFLLDSNSAHYPYGTREPKYFLWDRYNYALKSHFYTDAFAFTQLGKPDKKFCMLVESTAVIPQVCKQVLQKKNYMENEYNLVFTHNEEILNTLSNARYVPFSGSPVYGRNDSSAISPENYMNKDKDISIIASRKAWLKMHVVRQDTARKCKRIGLADTFGEFAGGGEWVPIELPFKHYRYSIVIENDITSYYFTEKIANCFISQTIPIYLGASHITDFFNPDGIIQISLQDLDNLEAVLKQCTPQEYERRLPAVLDNFQRVQEFMDLNAWMYERYLKQYYD